MTRTLWASGAMALIALSACTQPQVRIDRLARHAHLQRQVVTGTVFRHVLYQPEISRPGPELHVYIEGDGAPYRNRYTPAGDPTPASPLALRLMSEDAAPTLYLGRPCYFGLAHDEGCNKSYWTFRRFSPEVIASMVRVLRMRIDGSSIVRVTLIGHSGGATLALLIAADIPEVDRIVTVTGNLDVADWTRLHGYLPLDGSLDPMTQPKLRTGVAQIHYAGAQDANIPAALIVAATATLGGEVVIVPGFNHQCCWEGMWPQVLRRLAGR